MKILDIVKKKNNKEILTKDEIDFVVNGYTNNKIKDKDMTLFLKAVCEHGMNEEEVINMTDVMLHSGGILDLSSIAGVKADKHSTGGVGDKTTLIVASLVASCGINVAKMSGKALGFTGGTIDKLESIPGFKVHLSGEEFMEQLNLIHVAITSQTDNLVVADKKIYALRDVTNTVSSIPLIASSIMSKKLATDADVIVLDVKVGDGALLKTLDESRELANLMIKIGKSFGKKIVAVLSSMDEPLGYNIGNSLEIEEVISVLKGEGESNLEELSKELAIHMVALAKDITYVEAIVEVEEALNSGSAYVRFLDLVRMQHGNLNALSKAQHKYTILSTEEGYVKNIKTRLLGEYSMALGAGRVKKEDKIDYTVGLRVPKKIGDFVRKNDVLLEIYTNKKLNEIKGLEGFLTLSKEKVPKNKVIIEVIK